MATVFFKDVFGNELAPRVMSGIIAFSIFGNIVVMTFTASRGTISYHISTPHRRPLIFLLYAKSNRKLPKKVCFRFLSFSPAAPQSVAHTTRKQKPVLKQDRLPMHTSRNGSFPPSFLNLSGRHRSRVPPPLCSCTGSSVCL